MLVGAGGGLLVVEGVLRGEDADGSLRVVEHVLRTVIHQHGKVVLPDERVGAAAAAVAGQGGLQVGRVEAAAAVGVVHVVPAVWKFPPPKHGRQQQSSSPSPTRRDRDNGATIPPPEQGAESSVMVRQTVLTK